MNDSERRLLKFKLATIFSPTSPIDQYALFAGRKPQIDKVFRAVGQKGEHVIIYGERGVGKTSLANVLAEFLAAAGLQNLNSVKVNCDAKDNFSTLWGRIFRELKVTIERKAVGFQADENVLEKITLADLAEKKNSPDDVRYFLQMLPGTTIIIIDELDRIKDRDTTTQLADTVKSLSDHSVKSTLVLLGVADSVDEVIADHQSIARALVQVHMPSMSLAELAEIIDKGLKEAGMIIRNEAEKHIITLSQGLPHYTHLLGLLSAEYAVEHDRLEIYMADVQEAVKGAIDRTNQSNVQNYRKATYSSHKESLYAQVLLACALSSTDFLGYFAAADVRTPFSKIMAKSYDIPAFARHLNEFCDSTRGAVLKRAGEPRRYRYRFDDPQMRPFVTMNGLAKKVITESVWKELSDLQMSN